MGLAEYIQALADSNELYYVMYMLQGHEQICIRGKKVDIHGNTNLALHSTTKLWMDGWMDECT